MAAPFWNSAFGPSGTAGTITTVAGTGTAGTAGDGASATTAQLSGPTDVTFDNSGNLLVTQGFSHSSDKRFRKINTSGVISTVSGSTSVYGAPAYMAVAPNDSLYYEDGYVLGRMTPPSSTQQALRSPLGEVAGDLVIDGAGNVYYGSVYGIEMIKASGGIVNLLNGTVCGIAFNQAGELLFTGWSGNAARECTGIGKIDLNDTVTQLATGLPADLNGIVVDSADGVFISRNHDYFSSYGTVDKLVGTGLVTVAGTSTAGFSGDGGPATAAQLDGPLGLALDDSGNLFIADEANNRVREVFAAGASGVTRPASGPQLPPPPSPDARTLGGCATTFTVCSSTTAVDPINTALGSFAHSEDDALIQQIGTPLAVTRFYNSADTTIPADLGPGWARSFAEKITQTGPQVTVHADDGQRFGYTLGAGGSITPASGVRAILTATANGGYTLTDTNQKVHTFDANGRITSLLDGNGEGVTLTYSATGLLQTVTGAAGALTYVHNLTGQLTTVTLPDGRHVDYAYTADGHLDHVTELRGNVISYGYDSHGLLSRIVNQNGDTTLSNVYGSDGRISSQADGEGKTTTLSYGSGTTVVTDPLGHASVDSYYADLLMSHISPLDETTSYKYDSQANRISVTDPLGNATYFTYDGLGDITEIQQPTIGGVTPTTDVTYDGQGRPLTVTDPDNRVTHYGYDSRGNLIDVTAPDGGRTAYTSNSRGLVTDVTDPMGRHTTHSYDSAGRPLTSTTSAGTTSYSYDNAGRLGSQVDPRGNVIGANPNDYRTQYGYDAADHVTSLTTALGSVTMSDYDPAGRLTKVTDPLQRVTSFEYNVNGQPTRTIRPDGNSVRTTYNDDGTIDSTYDVYNIQEKRTYDKARRVTSDLRFPSRGTLTTYDADGHVLSQADLLGNKTTFTYDAVGRTASTVSPRGNATGATAATYTTRYDYDPSGLLVSIAAPANTGATFGYDAAGRRSSTIDKLGRSTTVTYNLNGDVTKTSDPASANTLFSYDTAGRRVSSTDALNKTTGYSYDPAGNLNKITTPLGAVTTIAYDAERHPTSATNPLGNQIGAQASDYTSRATYDAAGQVTSITDALGHLTTYTYTNLGQTDSTTDANSHETDYSYDGAGNLTEVTNPNGDFDTTYSYNNYGNRIYLNDGNRHTTQYSYDAAGRQTSVTTPEGKISKTGYDENGNITSATNPANAITHYLYDPADRLATTQFPAVAPVRVGPLSTITGLTTMVSAADISYTYNTASELKTVTEGASTNAFTYDLAGRVINYTVDGRSVAYQYDAAGHQTRLSYPDGTVNTSSYNDDGQQAGLTTPTGSFSYTYDTAGQLTRRTLPAGITEDRAYNRDGRIRSINVNGTSAVGTVHRELSRTYDPAGNVASQTTLSPNSTSSATANYSYDLLNRLTSVCYTANCAAGTPGTDAVTSYTYDGTGNRLTETHDTGTTAYAYNNDDQLTSVTSPRGVATAYTYDANGNTSSVGTRALDYDQANRLTLVDDNGKTTRYGYDGLGHTTRRSVGVLDQNVIHDTLATQLTYNPLSHAPQLLSDTAATNSALSSRYSSGPGGYQQRQSPGAYDNYLLDPQGSVLGTVDGSNGIVRGSHAYDPFGQPRLGSQAGAPTGNPTVGNALQYIGGYQDASTGLYNLGARQYSSSIGRFLEKDPLGQPTIAPREATYVYGHNDPLTFADPTGQRAEPTGCSDIPSPGQPHASAITGIALPADYIPLSKLFMLEAAGCLTPTQYEHSLSEAQAVQDQLTTYLDASAKAIAEYQRETHPNLIEYVSELAPAAVGCAVGAVAGIATFGPTLYVPVAGEIVDVGAGLYGCAVGASTSLAGPAGPDPLPDSTPPYLPRHAR